MVINFCLVGYASMGEIHSQNLLTNPSTNLKYVVGTNEKKLNNFCTSLSKKYYKLVTPVLYKDIEKFLPKVDALLISSATPSHYNLIMKGIKANLAIFCEKPLCVGNENVKKCIDEAKKNNVLLFCGFHRRFDSEFLRVKQSLKEKGKMGNIEVIRITSRDPYHGSLENIKSVKDEDLINVVYQSVIHDIDMACWLTELKEEPELIYAVQPTKLNFAAILKLKNGILITIDYAKAYGYDQRVEVHGSEGVILLDNKKKSQLVFGDKNGLFGDSTHSFFHDRYADAYIEELNHFIDCFNKKKNGEEYVLRVPLESCLLGSKIADGMLNSIKYDLSRKSIVKKVPRVKESIKKQSIKLIKEKKLNIVLVGAGRMGILRAESFIINPKVKLVYIVDLNVKAATELAKKCNCLVSDSLEKVLKEKKHNINCVWIAVSTPYHLNIIKQVKDLPIFCEKPVALNIDEITQCFEIAKGNGLPLCIGYNRRFDPAVMKLRELYSNSKEMGKILTYRYTVGDHPLPPVSIMKSLGSIFQDLLIHNIDCTLYLNGGVLPSTIMTIGSSFIEELKENGVYDTGILLMTFPTGEISIEVARRKNTYGHDQRFEVLGTKKMVKVENYSKTSVYEETSNLSKKEVIHNSFDDRYEKAHQNEIDHFYDVVVNGKEPNATYEQCFNVGIITSACDESDQKKKIIVLSDDEKLISKL